jgi:hypothetical protein
VREYLLPEAIAITTLLAPVGDRMLDGKRYYAAFPDENPERPTPRALLNALEQLEAQFRKHIKEFRVKAARSASDDCEEAG